MMGRARRRPRVFLGPVEIAGYYAGLETGLRDLGIDALAVDLERHPFSYRTNGRRDPALVRLAYRVRDRRPIGPRFQPRTFVWLPLWVGVRILLTMWAAARFDVFIFSAGVTLLRGHDLPLLRRLGKRIIVVFHGSDARPAYIDGQVMAPHRQTTIAECIETTRWRKNRIRRLERHAHVIVAQPANSHLFGRQVVNWFLIGVPWRDRPRAAGPVAPDRRSRGAPEPPVRILHTPSDAPLKGSEEIRAAVEQLKAEGLRLELVELRGVPNDEVLDALEHCDFVVDQLYSDAPMVGFATEAAVASRAAIVGGYATAANRSAFGPIPYPPVEECRPDKVVDAIRRLATEQSYREALGLAAHDFVHAHWSREQIARRFVRLMAGSPPPDWMFDPRTLRYVEGCGLPSQLAAETVRAVLQSGGRPALYLADKPELEAAFVAFADSPEPSPLS